MKSLLYATGNAIKFRLADSVCQTFDLSLQQISMDIPEIQAHSGEEVARDKVLRMFEALQKPVVISDDSWMIPALKDFPGPYMKFFNGMFTAEDWLRLVEPLSDRRIILRQVVAYQDKHQQQLFYTDIEGVLLTEIRGRAPFPHMSITSFNSGKTSLAEDNQEEKSSISKAVTRTSWHDFCEWYTSLQD